jgi:hypothetical protein
LGNPQRENVSPQIGQGSRGKFRSMNLSAPIMMKGPLRGVSAASCAADVTPFHVTGFGDLLPRASNSFFDISGSIFWRSRSLEFDADGGLEDPQGRFTPHSQLGHKIKESREFVIVDISCVTVDRLKQSALPSWAARENN